MKNEVSQPVIVEQEFRCSIDDVWESFTEINRMRQWFFENIPEFKAEVGFRTEFNVQSESRHFLHVWEVTEVVPQERLTIHWQYGGYAGDSYVDFELFEHQNGSHLRLTHRIIQDFPQDISEFSRESCLAGWTYFINDRLRNYLEKKL